MYRFVHRKDILRLLSHNGAKPQYIFKEKIQKQKTLLCFPFFDYREKLLFGSHKKCTPENSEN